MKFNMTVTLRCLAAVLVLGQSEASVANLLADRALAKVSDWIRTDGPAWLKLPAHFQQGLVHELDNRFTLAFAGPKLASVGDIARSSDAILDEAEYDPMYKTRQRLRFKATLANVSVIYDNTAYTEDNLGSFTFPLTATSASTSVDITLDIKGDLETCVGFPDTIDVKSNGPASITVGDKDVDGKIPAVIAAVSSHFQNALVESLQILLQSGIFSSLENYDICNDAYNPLLPANMLAERILDNVVKGLNSNVSNWAWLPGFWKQFHAPNGTVTNFLTVDVGNFSSAGNLRRAGDATYSNEGSNQSIAMNFETDSMTAFYSRIYFTDRTTQYNLSDRIKTEKLTISLSLQFYKSPYTRVPICNNQSSTVDVTYGGGPLQTELNPALPHDLFNMVNSTVADGFLRSLRAAAIDLFHTAAMQSLQAVCPTSNKDLLPPADEMADQILTAMGELVAKHASDWTHLPGSSKQYYADNGTLIYYIAAGLGNFTDGGSIQRLSASYADDDSSLNIVFETDSMTAIYGNVVYASNWVKYIMVETIKTKKLKTSMSVSFSPDERTGIPTCYQGSVASGVFYEGGELDVKNLTPGVPDDVQASVASQLSSAFLNDVIGAAEELFNTVAKNALAEVCTHTEL